MSEIKDGGPAAGEFKKKGELEVRYGGLTIRDAFALSALPAVIEICGGDTIRGSGTIEDYFARKSYAIADAMLRERDQS